MRELLRTSRVLRWLRAQPVALPYRILLRITRVRPERFLFLSDSHLGFTGNMGFVRGELLRRMPEAQVAGVFKPHLTARRPVRDVIRLPWLLATSGTIVVDDFYPIIYPLPIRRGARLVQIWHAAGAFKQVGHSRAGLPGGPVPGSDIHRNYTHVPVSSESIRTDYAEAFGIDVSRVQALGVPRTDAFFDADRVTTTRARVRARLGVRDDARVVLYAPTFRGNGQRTARPEESADWGRVAAELGEGFRVVVRQHPFAAKSAPPLPDGVLDGGSEEMNDLLMATDILVTDYSSSIFEFALLRRPVVLFVPDLDDYAGSRSFYRPFDSYAIGPVVREPADLAAALRRAEVDDAVLDTFLEEFCGALDGGSTARIVERMLLASPERVVVDEEAVAPGSVEPTRAEGAMGLRVAAARLARIILSVAYAPLKLLPVQRKVVMISREHPVVPDDFTDLAAALTRHDDAVRVVMLVRMVPPGILRKIGYGFHLLRQLYHVATARVLIIDTYAIVASVLRHRDELTVIQMWHALGAFKKFGLSILGREEGRDRRLADAMRMHQGYDLVLTSAEECRPAFADAFGTPLERVAVAPLPRVDRLRDPARRERTRARILAALPHLAGRRIAVFAPTFRLDGTVAVDVRALTEALHGHGVHTVVKLHPLMHADFGPDVDTGGDFSTQEMLAIADLFITDYSSALYEASVLDIPTYFLTPDLDAYLESRDFYLDYRRDLPGPIVRTVDELARAIGRADASAADAQRFARRWVQVPGDPAPAPGATPCADAIAEIVSARLGDPRS
ncbi:CDP-glycerol glycerophosphotransferase family protein [Microbacterium oleivorans]|uniref:CDP-glycerol glycerophosphotransferase family protein n=1 Tax=Microbacterium oleivorans TaxID=273677 RepID=UPI001CB99C03|nr:CDP-glycerol glycerophosphotransferase family protein [Microbacterium oleivorans]